MNNRYEVKNDNGIWKVFDTKKQVSMTNSDVPSKEIAQEICDDFNKMEKGDYSPIWKRPTNLTPKKKKRK